VFMGRRVLQQTVKCAIISALLMLLLLISAARALAMYPRTNDWDSMHVVKLVQVVPASTFVYARL
jgi:hypothetical protein